MKLQRENFTICSISELDKLDENNKRFKKVIDLCYMSSFEYEGNIFYIEIQKNDLSNK